jgi:hypothetical protein
MCNEPFDIGKMRTGGWKVIAVGREGDASSFTILTIKGTSALSVTVLEIVK